MTQLNPLQRASDTKALPLPSYGRQCRGVRAAEAQWWPLLFEGAENGNYTLLFKCCVYLAHHYIPSFWHTGGVVSVC